MVQEKEIALSDHLFHLSAGISITLGSKGWNSQQNRVNDLLTQNSNLSAMNRLLVKENSLNSQIMTQMRKILEIEGLLSRFQDELAKSKLSPSNDTISGNNLIYYPQNDYSKHIMDINKQSFTTKNINKDSNK